MKNIAFFLCIYCTLFFFSCTNDPIQELESDNYSPLFGIENPADARNLLSEYYIFSELTNGAITVSSKIHNNTSLPIICSQSAVFRHDLSNLNVTADGGKFEIDGHKIDFTNALYEFPPAINVCENPANLYGKNLEYALVRDGKELFNVQHYSPLQLTSFEPQNKVQLSSEYSHYFLDKSKPFGFSYNPDENNSNGVLLVAQGKGDLLGEFPQSHTNINYKVQLLQDNGFAEIPSSFFESFKDNELITLSLYRGGFKKLTATDGYNYKMYTLSEISQEFIVTQ